MLSALQLTLTARKKRGSMATEDSGNRRGVTRRDAIKLVGAGAAGALAATAPAQAERKLTLEQADVVVVGAGMAGLAAARMLARQRKKVVVLEARDRVGGRVKSG